jgi:hypothetical protein
MKIKLTEKQFRSVVLKEEKKKKISMWNERAGSKCCFVGKHKEGYGFFTIQYVEGGRIQKVQNFWDGGSAISSRQTLPQIQIKGYNQSLMQIANGGDGGDNSDPNSYESMLGFNFVGYIPPGKTLDSQLTLTKDGKKLAVIDNKIQSVDQQESYSIAQIFIDGMKKAGTYEVTSSISPKDKLVITVV